MEELGKPKTDEARFYPRRRELGEREGEGPDDQGEKAGEVEEAGEGAEEGVVGEAAVGKEAGIGPPEEAEYAQAARRPAVEEV